MITYICENCKEEHDGNYGSGRFCSCKCARGFSTKNKRNEINDKVSLALTKEPYKKYCAFCNKLFFTKRKHRLLCSNRCNQLLTSDETKIKLSELAKQRGLGGHTSKQKLFFEKNNGEIIYLQSSYEIAFASILEKLNITWERPSPLKWIDDKQIEHRYYPDFKIGNVYVDTKNDYLAIIDLPKINAVKNQNNIDLRIVTKDMINEDYIRQFL